MSITQDQKAGRKWGLALTFVAPVGLWHVGRDAANSIRDTLARSTATVRAIRAGRQPPRLDWNTTIAVLGVTRARIQREVVRRQVMAAIAALFFFVGLSGVLVHSAFLPGIGCSCLAAVYYLQSSLRLHQIRNHEFISIVHYFARVRRDPRELLPRRLPAGWKMRAGSAT